MTSLGGTRSRPDRIDLTRGSGFSGVPEAIVAALTIAGTLAFPPQGGNALLAAIVICAVAGASGRWPLMAGGLVAVAVVASRAVGIDIGFGTLALVVAVQAIGTLGRRIWAVVAVLIADLVWVNFDKGPAEMLQDAAVTAVLLAGAAMIGLLRHRAHFQRAELAEAHEAQLADLRREIARDLHDSIAHDLTTVVLTSEQMRVQQPPPDELVREQLQTIADTGRRSLQDMRTVLEVLRRVDTGRSDGGATAGRLPTDLHASGPRVNVMEALVDGEERLRAAGFAPEISGATAAERLSPLVDEVLAKCLAELINNVLRHGLPGRGCVIQFARADGVVELSVTNSVKAGGSGKGSLGLGLTGVQERVEAVDGSTAIGRRGAQLWVAEITVPLDRSLAAGETPVPD